MGPSTAGKDSTLVTGVDAQGPSNQDQTNQSQPRVFDNPELIPNNQGGAGSDISDAGDISNSGSNGNSDAGGNNADDGKSNDGDIAGGNNGQSSNGDNTEVSDNSHDGSHDGSHDSNGDVGSVTPPEPNTCTDEACCQEKPKKDHEDFQKKCSARHKIVICKHPGNSGRSFEICVAESARHGQLTSGSYEGLCK